MKSISLGTRPGFPPGGGVAAYIRGLVEGDKHGRNGSPTASLRQATLTSGPSRMRLQVVGGSIFHL